MPTPTHSTKPVAAPPSRTPIPTAHGVARREAPSWHTFPLASRWARRIAFAVLAVVPFHAFLTVWASSFGINYTAVRLWTLLPLAALFGLAVYWLWRDRSLRRTLVSHFVPRTILIYAVLLTLLTLRGVLLGYVSPGAALLGLWLDLRYLLFFILVFIIAKYQRGFEKKWFSIVMAAGVVVAAFAVLQYLVLPDDFLRHFGYGPATIDPVETINNDPNYIRVSSFLRGANPLGAYLLLVAAGVAVCRRWWRRRTVWGLVLALVTLALIFSFSRSAWVGTVVALVVAFAATHVRTGLPRHRMTLVLLAIAAVTGAVFFLGTKNVAVQNALYHTSDRSTAIRSSNEQRRDAIVAGAEDVLGDPLGRGAGSAGPASLHNTKAPGKLAENYYLQIGQETGWAGLIAYLMLTAVLAFTLWKHRTDWFSRVLVASFVGLFVVNMLSHAWTDDTIAFLWWGLAGAAIGRYVWHPLQKPEA